MATDEELVALGLFSFISPDGNLLWMKPIGGKIDMRTLDNSNAERMAAEEVRDFFFGDVLESKTSMERVYKMEMGSVTAPTRTLAEISGLLRKYGHAEKEDHKTWLIRRIAELLFSRTEYETYDEGTAP